MQRPCRVLPLHTVCACAATTADCVQRRNSTNAVTGTNRSRRAHDFHSVAGLRTNTRVVVRRRRHCSKFPTEYPRRCPNILQRPATGGLWVGPRGQAAPTAAVSVASERERIGRLARGGGDDIRSNSGHLISCHFQFHRLEIPAFPPPTIPRYR